MKLTKLSSNLKLREFDCGDEDLNHFLSEDAVVFGLKRIANTFVMTEKETIIGYFCLLNDKISRKEITNSRWKKIKDSFPDSKRFGSYPTIKIGRFAISKEYHGQQLGTQLMSALKLMLNQNQHNSSAFRFLTVDAYLSAIPVLRT